MLFDKLKRIPFFDKVKRNPEIPPVSWAFLLVVLVIDFISVTINITLSQHDLIPWEPHVLASGAINFLIAYGALRWKRIPLRAIGLSLRGFAKELAIGVAVYLIWEAGRVFLFPLLWGRAPSWPITLEPIEPGRVFVLAILALSVGIGEEVLYRGFAISLLSARLQSLDLVVLISALAFGLGHLPRLWSLSDVLIVALSGIAYGLLYAWRGYNLTVPIVVHVLHNFVVWITD